MKTTVQTFNVSFPKQLVQQIDAKAKQQFGSRSDLLRQAVLQYMRSEQQWEDIFRYGKIAGAQIGSQSEEAVAASFTAERRKQYRRWAP